MRSPIHLLWLIAVIVAGCRSPTTVIAESSLGVERRSDLRISGDGAILRASIGSETHKIDLPESMNLDMDGAVLLAHQSDGTFGYLLCLTTGPSRRHGNPYGRCGAGIETSVIWLKLHAWRIVDSQQRRVESCWTDQSVVKGPHWRDRKCFVVFWDPHDDNSEVTLSYDCDKPNEGLSFTKKPFN